MSFGFAAEKRPQPGGVSAGRHLLFQSVSDKLSDGRARVQRGAMTSHGMAADLGGLIDLMTRSWALRINALQTDAAGEESHDAAHLTLDIAGPWSAPQVRAIGQGGATTAGSALRPSRAGQAQIGRMSVRC